MSTLQVGTIKSTSSSAPVFQNSSCVEKGMIALAWANVNGEGTASIRASFNFSSITDVQTGKYTMAFTNSMPDGNYALVMGVGDIGDSNRTVASFSETLATSGYTIETKYYSNDHRDCGGGYFAVFR